ncbi:MAG: alkaline phosphatase family protein [Chloroflexi bacterium]|nr:alkaline phosphatase family protein [Chloroflexota bacterium]
MDWTPTNFFQVVSKLPELSAELLSRLQTHQLPGLALGQGFLYPDYSGQSILNLPSAICSLFGVQNFGAPPLREKILSQLGGQYQRIILLLVDALSLHRFQSWMQMPDFAIWRQLAAKGALVPLTSVVPSTTCAALTTIWTGKAPAEHGIVGYEMWLKEYGVVANMITHAPFSFEGEAGTLRNAGFVPTQFLNSPTLSPHLAKHGVHSYALQPAFILGSGLSEMFFPEVTRIGYYSTSDFWITLRQLMQTKAKERAFIWAYWPEVDTLSHKYGPDDERVRYEFADFSRAFEQLFLRDLPQVARKETLFVLAADHGQVHTEKDPHYDLCNHPHLTRRLHLQPTGENRLIYLYIKPGQIEAVREYVERTWPNQFAMVESAYAQEIGLFGAGPASPRLTERLGDLILVARGSAYLWWGVRENPLVGRHGGLSAEEMLVPLLAAPLA